MEYVNVSLDVKHSLISARLSSMQINNEMLFENFYFVWVEKLQRSISGRRRELSLCFFTHIIYIATWRFWSQALDSLQELSMSSNRGNYTIKPLHGEIEEDISRHWAYKYCFNPQSSGSKLKFFVLIFLGIFMALIRSNQFNFSNLIFIQFSQDFEYM